jgi:hypothetical protein
MMGGRTRCELQYEDMTNILRRENTVTSHKRRRSAMHNPRVKHNERELASLHGETIAKTNLPRRFADAAA